MSDTFQRLVRLITPPWLQGRVGGGLMQAIAEQFDRQVDRMAQGVALRMPSEERPSALSVLSLDRRIRRGPGESHASFAARLRGFWDAHRARGNAYTLLRQLHLYFRDSNRVPIDLITNRGKHYRVDIDGTITRHGELADWVGDGALPERWARLVLLFYLEGTTIQTRQLDEDGNPAVDASGQEQLQTVAIDAMTDADRALFTTLAREWVAAHIDRIRVVLKPPDALVWDQPGLRWDDPGRVWGGETDQAVVFSEDAESLVGGAS